METSFERQVIVLCVGAVVFLAILIMPILEGLTLEGQRLLAVAAYSTSEDDRGFPLAQNQVGIVADNFGLDVA